MRRKNPETVGAVHTHTHTHTHTGILKLIIVIAVIVSFLLNIFTSHEISIFALKKEINFAEEITMTDENDTLEIIDSVDESNENDNEYEDDNDNNDENENDNEEEIDNEETEENIEEETKESENEETINDENEISIISTEIDEYENTNYDDEVQSIDDSSDYTITVTEYTGDTLEAEFDCVNGSFILYIVNAESWQLLNVSSFDFEDTTEYSFSDYYSDYYSLELGYKIGASPLFAYHYIYGSYTLKAIETSLHLVADDIRNYLFKAGSGAYGRGVICYEDRR